MNGLRIVCGKCQREWHFSAAGSTYLALNVMTIPCPGCEAYTLSCVERTEFTPDQAPRFAALASAPALPHLS
jgi:MinD superfamily P-loop ATPase